MRIENTSEGIKISYASHIEGINETHDYEYFSIEDALTERNGKAYYWSTLSP